MFKKSRLDFAGKDYALGGVVATVLAIASLIILGYAVYTSFVARGEAGVSVGILALVAMVVSVFGFLFGVLSYKEQDKQYGVSFFGTLVNGIIVVALVLFIL